MILWDHEGALAISFSFQEAFSDLTNDPLKSSSMFVISVYQLIIGQKGPDVTLIDSNMKTKSVENSAKDLRKSI